MPPDFTKEEIENSKRTSLKCSVGDKVLIKKESEISMRHLMKHLMKGHTTS